MLLVTAAAWVFVVEWFSFPFWWKLALAPIEVILAVVAVMFSEGWVTTLFTRADSGGVLTPLRGGLELSERAVVFFPGMACSGQSTSGPVAQLVLDGNLGDLVVVEYPQGKFDLDSLHCTLFHRLKSYHNVILVGASFGATVILDHVRWRREWARWSLNQVEGIVEIDGPACRDDIKDPMIGLANWLAPVAGVLMAKLWPKGQELFLRLKGELYVEPGTDLELLEQHRFDYNHFPPAGTIAQAQIIARSQPPVHGEFDDTLPLATIKCSGDDPFVKASAVGRWQNGFRASSSVIRGTVGHASPCEEPKAFRAALALAFDYILPSRNDRGNIPSHWGNANDSH